MKHVGLFVFYIYSIMMLVGVWVYAAFPHTLLTAFRSSELEELLAC